MTVPPSTATAASEARRDEPIRVLFVEDSSIDVQLACRQLEREQLRFECRVVNSDAGLRHELEEFKPHVVLSDFTMPDFSGLQALQIVKEMAPDTSLIFVSGTIGEEMAVQCLREGATDYVLKDNLSRLANTVQRAFEQAGRQAAAREAQNTRARLAEILEATPDIVSTVDSQGRIVYMNEAGCRLLGVTAEQIIGRPAQDFYMHAAIELMTADAIPTALEQGAWQGETALLTPDGVEIPVSQVLVAHQPVDGGERSLSSIARDERERKTFEDRIYHLARHDTQTGLPNRFLLGDRVTQALIHAKRIGRAAVLLSVHLNNLGLVADGLGHGETDKVLEEVAKRVRGAVRESDTVARIGVDEFAVLFTDLARPEDAHAVARKITVTLNPPIQIADRELRVAASIGAALFPDDGDDFDALLRNAGAAMRRVVVHGRDSLQFYASQMTTESLDRLEIETGLQGAMDRDEIVMHYQPQFDIATGRMLGVEALTRWYTPDGSAVSPLRFIAVAEETGMIRALGELALRRACADGLDWLSSGLPVLRMAVNVSTRQLSDETFADDVGRVLGETGFPATHLELEITETALMENGEVAFATLTKLKALGVKIAIDDFGTGFSSLSYLSQLPLDRLKVDRSFVQRMNGDRRDAGIVRTVVSLAHGLGLDVIAEGVETEQQLEMLAQMRCDEAQGYLLGSPVSAEHMRTLLEGKRSVL